MPDLLIEQPAKMATPELFVLTGLVVQVNAAPLVPVPEVMVSVTGLVVTGLPPASRTVTCGWEVKAVPPVALVLGWVLKLSEAGAPTVMLKGLLGADAVLRLSEASVAVSV